MTPEMRGTATVTGPWHDVFPPASPVPSSAGSAAPGSVDDGMMGASEAFRNRSTMKHWTTRNDTCNTSDSCRFDQIEAGLPAYQTPNFVDDRSVSSARSQQIRPCHMCHIACDHGIAILGHFLKWKNPWINPNQSIFMAFLWHFHRYTIQLLGYHFSKQTSIFTSTHCTWPSNLSSFFRCRWYGDFVVCKPFSDKPIEHSVELLVI